MAKRKRSTLKAQFEELKKDMEKNRRALTRLTNEIDSLRGRSIDPHRQIGPRPGQCPCGQKPCICGKGLEVYLKRFAPGIRKVIKKMKSAKSAKSAKGNLLD